MQGGQRPIVSGVHRLKHVERFVSAALPHDDAVGPHAQRISHQVSNGDGARPLRARRPCFQAHDVRMLQESQLGGILDGHDPLVLRNEA